MVDNPHQQTECSADANKRNEAREPRKTGTLSQRNGCQGNEKHGAYGVFGASKVSRLWRESRSIEALAGAKSVGENKVAVGGVVRTY